MTTTTQIWCDRCGRTRPEGGDVDPWISISADVLPGISFLDLCPACGSAFVTWLGFKADQLRKAGVVS